MEEARRLFAESPKDFRPVPWWCWTGDMTSEGMDRQLMLMREQGIFEFFIFGIYGLDVEFNSEAYFDLVAHTLRRCRQWGMRAWIYDEYNWPSGICGGKVLRDYPWARYKTLKYELLAMEPGQTVQVSVKGEFVRAFFVGRSGAVTALAAQPAPCAEGSPIFSWCNDLGEPGSLIVFSVVLYEHLLPSACGATWTWNQAGYLDVMNPEAVRVFIDYCYEPYAKRFADYLGKEIVGFFTDEPGLYVNGSNSFPYTLHLWHTFRQRYGYSLEEKLPELVVETGTWQTTRTDYWRLVSDLFAENYIRQINTWCGEHGVEFTGHFLGEETLRWDVRWSGDIARAARLMSVPGIDLLRDFTSYDIAPDQHWYGRDLKVLNTTAKVVSSAADYVGARRRLCEAYGVVDWDQSLARMKRLVDWLTALGFNLINDNTLIYSIQGFRKRRVSGKTFTTPWFPYYKHFSEHVGRVCWMTTVGEPVEEVGVLYPTISGWTLYGGMLPNSLEATVWPEMEKALSETTDALNRIQRGWKFLYDEELTAARVTGGKLVASGLPFTTIILPTVAALRRAVAEKLIEFAESGGTVLVVGRVPFLTPDPQWDVASAMQRLLAQPGVTSLPDPVWGAAYETWLDEHVARPTFAFSGPGRRQILTAQRRDGAHDYVFISNQTEQDAPISVSSAAEGIWEIWNPDSGEQWAVQTEANGSERIWSGVIAPMQSLYLVISRDAQAKGRPRLASLDTQSPLEKDPLLGTWKFERQEPNTILLDLSIRPDPNCEGVDKGWPFGQGEEWIPTQSGKTEIKLDPDELAYFWTKAEIDLAYLPADLELVLDSRDYGEVFVNGYRVSGGYRTTVWDDGNWAYPLRDYIFQGRNVIVLRCRPSKYYAQRVAGNVIDPYYVEPIVVRGSFAALRRDGRLVVVPETGEISLGAWEEQGYPAFCGSAIYRRTIELPQIAGRYWLVLEDVRQVAEVEVNGQKVGVCPWPPYVFDLTSALQPGANELAIRVTNSFGRLIRYSYTGLIAHEVLSGITGRAWLVRTRGD